MVRVVDTNLHNFRTLPSDLRATVASMEEEMLELKHVLIKERRSSLQANG